MDKKKSDRRGRKNSTSSTQKYHDYGSSHYGTRHCRVCKEKLNVYQERYGRSGKGARDSRSSGPRLVQRIVSDEGVCWMLDRSHVWFCNECWNQIISSHNLFIMDQRTPELMNSKVAQAS